MPKKMKRRKAKRSGKRLIRKPHTLKYRGYLVSKRGNKEYVTRPGSKVIEGECPNMTCAINLIDAMHGD